MIIIIIIIGIKWDKIISIITEMSREAILSLVI